MPGTCNDGLEEGKPKYGNDDTPAQRFRVGGSWGFFSTRLRFTGTRDASIQEHATAATFEVRPTSRLTLQAGLGAILGGTISFEQTSHRIEPGVLFSIAASYRVLDGDGALPFLLVSLSLAQSFARTREQVAGAGTTAMSAGDARIGAVIGKTFARRISPYLVARAFGGPVRWSFRNESMTGSDRYHYQLGVGFVLALGRGFDASFEGVFLGERRVTAGLGLSF